MIPKTHKFLLTFSLQLKFYLIERACFELESPRLKDLFPLGLTSSRISFCSQGYSEFAPFTIFEKNLNRSKQFFNSKQVLKLSIKKIEFRLQMPLLSKSQEIPEWISLQPYSKRIYWMYRKSRSIWIFNE